jgi:hypothetical protein
MITEKQFKAIKTLRETISKAEEDFLVEFGWGRWAGETDWESGGEVKDFIAAKGLKSKCSQAMAVQLTQDYLQEKGLS